MPMRPSDRILFPSRADYADGLAGLARVGVHAEWEAAEFATALGEACDEGGIDFAIAYAHCANETDYFRDDDFIVARNPAGIGHPDDASGGIVFATFRAGARFYVGEMLLKLRKPIPSSLADARSYAPEKWDQVVAIVAGAVGVFPVVATIADLNQRFGPNNREAVWMTDVNGPAAICAKGNALFPSLPDQDQQTGTVVFGRVPHPPFVVRDIPSSINTAWDDLGSRTIRAICWHRSQGTHQGNDAYFRGEGRTRALTDYGIGVAAVDGNLAGSIYRWNDPKGLRSPWANGRYSGAYGDGLAFGERYGVDAVNRDVTSVEISGFYPVPGEETRNTALDPASREAISALTAYWADRYRVSWETFPLIPAEGNRSFVIWHQEFTLGTGKTCPGPVVMGETDALIARAKAIMQRWQAVTPTTTTTPPPSLALPPGMSRGLAARLFNPVGVDHPATGTPAAFGIEERVSGEWLRRCMATIPDGKSWDSGTWPALASITKRGDGRLVWQFSNGSIVQETP